MRELYLGCVVKVRRTSDAARILKRGDELLMRARPQSAGKGHYEDAPMSPEAHMQCRSGQ